ncbi:hypothetical protein HF324_08830 [Chitinophaga oryzae]|uniref:Uncharacterized protein n=1 Tax=Chitinophaga oryzae TaxID=2725414 RepID=A0ABX6LDA8_9BACT|nr:hypothetical protein [Chitinophaga oryzae]QJB37945.1 hypothetical protein HF324_08830 [Chitinophaga oryzae]
MGTRKAKNIVWGLCLAAMASVVFTGCSKKDDPAPANKITIKYTVTATGVTAEDDVEIWANAGNHDASQYGASVWKINGADQGNADDVNVDETKFLGATKTYVFETVKSFDFGSLSVAVSNREGAPIIVSYKAEINGTVQTNAQNISVAAGTRHDKQFTYKGQ